jgi:hypothetical protein
MFNYVCNYSDYIMITTTLQLHNNYIAITWPIYLGNSLPKLPIKFLLPLEKYLLATSYLGTYYLLPRLLLGNRPILGMY